MTSPSERHNRLARDFTVTVVGETKSHAELMVVIESCLLSTMLVSNKVYDLTPAASVEMIELAIQRATARFAEKEPTR